MKKVKILTGQNIKAFQDEINAHLKKGYTICGNMTFDPENHFYILVSK